MNEHYLNKVQEHDSDQIDETEQTIKEEPDEYSDQSNNDFPVKVFKDFAEQTQDDSPWQHLDPLYIKPEDGAASSRPLIDSLNYDATGTEPLQENAPLHSTNDNEATDTTPPARGEDGRWKCATCTKSYAKEASLARHAASRSCTVRFYCKVCGREFASKAGFRRHLALHAGDGGSPQPCRACDATLSSKRALKTHMEHHHGQTTAATCPVCDKTMPRGLLERHAKTHAAKRPRSHPCPLCPRQFTRATSLSLHSLTHTGGKPHKCELCALSFRYREDYRNHAAIHADPDSFRCDTCGKSFASRRYLTVHLRTHSGQGPYVCGVCSGSFATARNLRQHSAAHAGVCEARCDLCDATFVRTKSLREHVAKQHGSALPLPCDVCGKAFAAWRDLNRHALVHTRPFACAHCSETFAKRFHLERHLRNNHVVWGNAAPVGHECARCGKSFGLESALAGHRCSERREAQTARKFACGECGSRFRDVNALEAHRRSPTPCVVAATSEAAAVFACDFCEKTFDRLPNRQRHALVHTRPYGCAFCAAAFARKSHLDRHVRSKHGDPSESTPHECRQCGRKFRLKIALVNHSASHRDGSLSDWTCADCGRCFRDGGLLTAHSCRYARRDSLKDTVGAKRYACEFCAKTFDKPDNLQKHKLVHTRPFECARCEQTFSKKFHFDRHVRNNHADSSSGETRSGIEMARHAILHRDRAKTAGDFGCDGCGCRFDEKGAFSAHSCSFALRKSVQECEGKAVGRER